MSTPRDILAGLMAPCGVYCQHCCSFVAVAPSAMEGVICWLPAMADIPQDSRVRAHAEMQRPEAFNHPAVAVLSAACGHVVFCLSLTSFGKRGIAAKAAERRRAGKIFDVARYAALREPATDAPGQLLLDYTGPRLDVQSYVTLQHGWWIESEYLRPTARSMVVAADLPRLAPLSLALLTAYFAQRHIDQMQQSWCAPMQVQPALTPVQPVLMPGQPMLMPVHPVHMPVMPVSMAVPLWVPKMAA